MLRPSTPPPFPLRGMVPLPICDGEELTAAVHPLARSGKWLSSVCGRHTRPGPSFTVSRSTSRASSRSLDQAVLCSAQFLGPFSGQRKGVEAKLRIERRGLVGEQPLEMLWLAAGNRGRD
jgi:hypothetical protein